MHLRYFQIRSLIKYTKLSRFRKPGPTIVCTKRRGRALCGRINIETNTHLHVYKTYMYI